MGSHQQLAMHIGSKLQHPKTQGDCLEAQTMVSVRVACRGVEG